MKTEVSRKVMYKIFDSFMFLLILAFAVIMLFVGSTKNRDWNNNANDVTDLNGSHTNFTDNKSIVSESSDMNANMKLEYVNPVSDVPFAIQPEMELETEKLLSNAKQVSEKMEMELLMAKVQEYLIPEPEPKLDIVWVKSTVFSDADISEKAKEASAHRSGYIKNKYLEKWGREKYNEVLEYYALEKRAKEFLVAEPEPPLLIEDWMFDEKCWCSEANEPVAAIKK